MIRAKALEYTHASRGDIAEIRTYLIENAGRRVADLVVRRLHAAVTAKREIPLTGTPRPEYGATCRFLTEHPYVIYYDFDGARMRVLRVFHHARDRARLMGEPPPES